MASVIHLMFINKIYQSYDSVGSRAFLQNMKLFTSVKLIYFNTFAISQIAKNTSFVPFLMLLLLRKRGLSFSICSAINIQRPNSQRTHVLPSFLNENIRLFCCNILWSEKCTLDENLFPYAHLIQLTSVFILDFFFCC